MAAGVAVRPAICLSMIVRNEAHIVGEALDSIAPYISSWVIVDTGSDDGTQDLIRGHMAGLGIPGELHQRPWRDFGHNRTEALNLAQGHGDYIWVMDADDILVGTPDFSGLSADVYRMRYAASSILTYWYPLLFRDGVAVHYRGVTHEHPKWDRACLVERLDGDYRIEDRQRSSRNLSGRKAQEDRDLLLAEVQRNPADTRSVFYLAQSYFALGDFASARTWYARRVELGGWDEEVYYAMFRVAESMSQLNEPWQDVQDAYLKAWEFRPTRAEALYALACRYRLQKHYRLGHLFAERAAAIPFPERDVLFVNAVVHDWAALSEQAICAYWIGEHAEAFALCRRLLARPDLPERDRQRIARNRDFSVPTMIEAASSYPDVLARSLTAGSRNTEVTVSLVAGPDRGATEQMLDSFLHCCLDVSRVGRFLVLDAGLSTQDRLMLGERYPFLEFAEAAPGDQSAQLRAQIGGRFWVHLGSGWRFFAPENLITRLTAVLDAEPQVFQVGINLADAVQLTGSCAAEEVVRRTPDAGRYVLTDSVARGPAMFDTARLNQAGRKTASLDEVLCITAAAVPEAAPEKARVQVIEVHPPVAPAAGPSERKTNEDNNGPIFIGGTQRSGTTLMRVLLDSHRRICCGPELKILPIVAEHYKFLAGRNREVMASYGNALPDVQRSCRAFVEGLVANFVRAQGKPRWAEKTPQNVLCMALLGEIFPDAKFIHLLRDGRDVACSLVTQDWVDAATGRKFEMVESMTGAARYWRDMVTQARQQAAHPSLTGRVLEVRYEALVTETAATMRQVLDFLGEEWDDAVLTHHTKDRRGEPVEPSTAQVRKPMNESALGRWQYDMTEPDKAVFKAEAGALLAELGYAGADW